MAIIAFSVVLITVIVAVSAIMISSSSTTQSPAPTPTPVVTPEPEPEPVHTYEVRVAKVTWDTAYESAKAAGGYLVVINDQEEFNKIISLLSAPAYSNFVMVSFP